MLFYLEPFSPKPACRFDFAGIGVQEPMKPMNINRPNGTWDWLLMYFHEPVTVKDRNGIHQIDGKQLIIWSVEDGHYYGNESIPWLHSWCHFYGVQVEHIIKDTGLPTNQLLSLEDSTILENCLTDIYNEKTRENGSDHVILENLFTIMIRRLARQLLPGYDSLQIPEKVKATKNYIESNFMNKVTLSELSSNVGCSIQYLSREFKKHVGNSPVDYLIQVRIKQAKYHLLNLSLNISEIAALAGYDNLYQFSAIFKKHTGHSPSEFRQTAEKETLKY